MASIDRRGWGRLAALALMVGLGVPTEASAQTGGGARDTLKRDSAGGADSLRAQTLGGVTVTAPVIPYRYADFERRKATGRGTYITRADLEAGGYSRLIDALGMVRGVQMECAGAEGCIVRMARAPRGCPPQYYVDDQLNNSFGPLIPIRDVEAVEVYTGASSVPAEFGGRTAGCGVIAIWTGVPPRARRTPDDPKEEQQR